MTHRSSLRVAAYLQEVKSQYDTEQIASTQRHKNYTNNGGLVSEPLNNDIF